MHSREESKRHTVGKNVIGARAEFYCAVYRVDKSAERAYNIVAGATVASATFNNGKGRIKNRGEFVSARSRQEGI